MFDKKINYKLINILLILLIVYILMISFPYWGGFINRVFSILAPFIFAFCIAYILNPFVDKLENMGVKRGLAICLIVITILLVFTLLLVFSLPALYTQLVNLFSSIVNFTKEISTKLNLNSSGLTNKISEIFNDIVSDFGKNISDGTIQIIGQSLSAITNFFIILVVGTYSLIDMPKIRKQGKSILRKIGKRSYVLFTKIDKSIENYAMSIIKLMIVTFFEYTILYLAIGHPNWLLLGILMAIAVIVPFVGGIAVNIIALITAFVTSTPLFIVTLVMVFIMSNVDGYIIVPHIYGKSNNISPVGIIISLVICSSLFGLIGFIISIPLYIVIRTCYKYFLPEIKDKFDDLTDKD